MQKKLINEIFLLRSFACLSLVLLHAFARAYLDENHVVNMISVLLTFGTPVFVFISEFIMARSYPDKLPDNFWNKRFKFVLLPYLFFGTFYAFSKGVEQSLSTETTIVESFVQFLWRHILLGDFHGYFILIILQFYILHALFHKHLQRWSPKIVLGVSFIINMAYLSFFNFTEPIPTIIGSYVWEKFYWIPFLGWLFYFTLAYYCGRYYSDFIKILTKYSKLVIISPVLMGGICLALYSWPILPVISSKRIDMLLFSVCMLLLIYHLALKMSDVPKILVWISQYSFGIYLFHPFFLALMYQAFKRIPISFNPMLMTIFYFVGSIVISAVTMYVINKIPYGFYLSGKIGVGIGDRTGKKGKVLLIEEKSPLQGKA